MINRTLFVLSLLLQSGCVSTPRELNQSVESDFHRFCAQRFVGCVLSWGDGNYLKNGDVETAIDLQSIRKAVFVGAIGFTRSPSLFFNRKAEFKKLFNVKKKEKFFDPGYEPVTIADYMTYRYRSSTQSLLEPARFQMYSAQSADRLGFKYDSLGFSLAAIELEKFNRKSNVQFFQEVLSEIGIKEFNFTNAKILKSGLGQTVAAFHISLSVKDLWNFTRYFAANQNISPQKKEWFKFATQPMRKTNIPNIDLAAGWWIFKKSNLVAIGGTNSIVFVSQKNNGIFVGLSPPSNEDNFKQNPLVLIGEVDAELDKIFSSRF